jgi:L-asparaginase II
MHLAPLAEVTRGDAIESLHFGAVAVVNVHGELLHRSGDADFFTFTRSTLKPFQAAPLVRDGGVGRFGFTEQETALLCASHSGESMHVEAVQSMLAKIGCTEHHLRCGCHEPIYQNVTGTVSCAGQTYNQLHNNCSGKHAGFLAYCVQHGHPLDSYIDPGHPLQQAVRASVAHFSGVNESGLGPVIDGCSAPNYAMPLARLAYAYARLAHGAADDVYGNTLERLYQAMTRHPEMVSGTGRFDLALMQAAPGDWVAKGGAEGVQVIGIRSAGLGIAIKVADGNSRGLYPAALAVLQQLGLLGDLATPALAAWVRPQLTNLNGLRTGEVRATVELTKV